MVEKISDKGYFREKGKEREFGWLDQDAGRPLDVRLFDGTSRYH